MTELLDCPKCGSDNTTTPDPDGAKAAIGCGTGCLLFPVIGWIIGPMLIAGGLIGRWADKRTDFDPWRCKRCHHTWKVPRRELGP